MDKSEGLSAEVFVNDTVIGESKIVVFDSTEEEMTFENPNILPADILIFGGQLYTAPIISDGNLNVRHPPSLPAVLPGANYLFFPILFLGSCQSR